MALTESFEKSGNILFKYRGQIPVSLFIIAIPVIWSTDVSWIPDWGKVLWLAIAIFLSGTGFLVRSISIGTTPKGTSGRNTSGQVAESLNKTGIYSMVRHPLYLGNFLMWIGIVAFTFNIWFIVIITLAFWLYYERIMFAEEKYLEKEFGEDFLEWSRTVPPFLPSFGNYKKGTIPFSLKSVLRREYSGFLATVIGFVYIDAVRSAFQKGGFVINPTAMIVLGVAILITLLLRTIKHQTNWLKEEGRS